MPDTTDMTEIDSARAATTSGTGHGDAGHEDGHAPAEPLGPVDVTTWAYALAGSLLGLLAVLALLVARAV